MANVSLESLFLTMEIHHVCRVAIAPLREHPSDRSEIVSQLLFGDRVTMLEKTEKWSRVVTHHDQYEGWMDHKQLESLPAEAYINDEEFVYLTPVQLENILVAPNGAPIYLSPTSTLPFYKDGLCSLGNKKYEVKFEPILAERSAIAERIEKEARFFLNAPYLWGGRSLFGIDCSGFVQTVYRLYGLHLQRDASKQAEQGNVVDFLTSAKLGDLAFFDNDSGNITHVGMMLSNNEIIHAAGMVRIDPIDGQGIFNTELGCYTHKLRIIKRFF